MENEKEKTLELSSEQQQELDEAVKAALDGAPVYIHKLSKPLEHLGNRYTQLQFRWGELTGRDTLAICEDLRITKNETVLIPAYNVDFLVRMAAKSCTEKIGADVLESLPIVDFNKIWSKARNFLLSAG